MQPWAGFSPWASIGFFLRTSFRRCIRVGCNGRGIRRRIARYFTFIIFAFEITRDYNSVLPLMLVSVIAAGIAMLLMPSASIMTEKLVRRGLRIHQDYEADVLQQMTVSRDDGSRSAQHCPPICGWMNWPTASPVAIRSKPASGLVVDGRRQACRRHYARGCFSGPRQDSFRIDERA